ILGTTGSGKTVLMESIIGAYPATRGQILVDGRDVSALQASQLGMGVLYQDYALFPHMTVRDNIAYGLKRSNMRRKDIDRQVEEMLDLFGIQHLAGRYPGVISGGEAQRVALARALVLRPAILILDEPFSALDPTTKQQMYAMLRKVHADFGCTIVFVTHDFHEAQTLADRVGIILQGGLQCVLDASCLFEANHSPEVARFLGISNET
ncbi:MAG: ATP-binding cassette domain-containing protein, partial [Eggerthellaceae bacterium]|nr:ATP-binding cassette domain-containing protein [Eggerthellaceae bacterium]